MRGLVIDTALGGLSVALFEHGTILASRHELMARGHQERLGELVRDVAAEAGGFDGLGRITVTVGPGSFTGLRVGLAFALGLGAALDRPVLGITTLAALAGSVDSPGDAAAGLPVLAALDARRGAGSAPA
ncbi:MAG: tRNA (adenosine(37)-N6)-threonylcarbamoyltransferase complex dimerization subunit type 1 TsaB, partial [Brevundimonas sp.]|uniref:tRNA (adenosine(37)-N6)-threonylcarbamoyltransferase complex dimerization subunit type 1 TsaB n=1 Tax=Brevundimonas sp. TaxID=1871086 RepID=UPI00391D7156